MFSMNGGQELMEQRTAAMDRTDPQDRILPLLSESGDRRLVTEWIEDHPSYEPVELTGSVEDTTFDVCLLDTAAFQEHLPALRAKKSASAPVMLPYLLLLNESDSDIIDIDGGDLVENVVTESIDEIVTMPIQQAELHWRLSALLRLREQSLTLRQRERDLERQVEHLETIDRMLRHNLRNDMNVILGHAELVRSETSGDVAQSAAKIGDITNEVMEMAEKEREISETFLKNPAREEISIKPTLQRVVSTVKSDHPEATISAECPEDVTVRATAQLKQALLELVENGVTHDGSDSPDVAVTVTRSNGKTYIDIADTGPPIPEIEQNVLNERAEQTPVYHGTGLGLWLAKLITTRSGGTITVNENTPTGNVVRITFQR